jgi:DNA-directed RNA polymerase subunit RPC12/RpoP
MNAERIRYRCNSCRFEFTRKADVALNHCPYCGKDTFEEQKGDYASRILKESD